MMAQLPWPSLQRRAMLRISAVKKDFRIFLGLAQASCGHGEVTFECVGDLEKSLLLPRSVTALLRVGANKSKALSFWVGLQ